MTIFLFAGLAGETTTGLGLFVLRADLLAMFARSVSVRGDSRLIFSKEVICGLGESFFVLTSSYSEPESGGGERVDAGERASTISRSTDEGGVAAILGNNVGGRRILVQHATRLIWAFISLRIVLRE